MAITITFSVAGSYTIEDDGIAGNGTSIVRRDSDGAILAFIPHPADSLTIRATVPGVNLTFNVTDSFGTGALIVGNLVDPNQTPDSIVVTNIRSSSSVTLVSNGSILEGGSDVVADIVSSSLILSAQTGIGTGANALETQTPVIEAETVTGGIAIGNFGDVHIGGFSADVDGLDVVTSGDIHFTNLGSITLSDETSFDSVHGGDVSGNVTLIANGFDSDITSDVDHSAIIAPRGSVFLTAGRDISFGLAGADFGNDVRADGDIVVNVGRDFLLSGFADFFANGVLGNTGGGIVVNAGRNVSLLDDTGNSASLATLGSNGGAVVVTTGANGVFTLEVPSTNGIFSSASGVTINADRIVISATSGITVAGTVTLAPVSDGREILLGSLSDSGVNALELSDGELDRIFSNDLVLGSTRSGLFTIGAPIAPGAVANWTLVGGTDIMVNASLTVPGALTIRAGDNIFQTAGTLTAATVTALVDRAGGDGGIGGIANFAGSLAAGAINISGQNDADTLVGSGANETMNGLGGNDLLRGNGGDDHLDGGFNADVLHGEDGNDTLIGSNGHDTLYGGDGADVLRGGRANDQLYGGNGNDDLDGGLNQDVLYGEAGNDTLVGGNGHDTLYGGANDDLLKGGRGTDVLEGGAGRDIMFGGLEADTFVFRDGDFAGLTPETSDRIEDFSQSEGDTIDLGFVDADTVAGDDQAFNFIGTGGFNNVAGELRYETVSGNTHLYGDTDGDGVADFMILLTGTHALSESDFVI